MTAVHVYTYENPVSERDLRRMAAALDDDGLLIAMTDVNWAFICRADRPRAIDRLRRLKPEHPKELPFSLLCADFAMVAHYGTLESSLYATLRKFLPGPYTLILPRGHLFPRDLKDKRKTVGVRIPARPFLLELVQAIGVPLVTSSLTTPHFGDEESAKSYLFGYDVMEDFDHAVDMVVDLGIENPQLQTTILEAEGPELMVIREGAGVLP